MAVRGLPEFEGREKLPALMRAMLRPRGGDEHERLKMVAWLWLVSEGCEIADFEIGGFDVLGLRFPNDGTSRAYHLDHRIVLDAKASVADLVAHFRKDQIPGCDIDGKFSEYANLHYIIATAGRIKPDAVYAPWGLLEYDGAKVGVTKEAEARAYLGSRNDELREIASRTTKLFAAMLDNKAMARRASEPRRNELLKSERNAREYIEGLQDRLAKLCTAFECLYGHNPLRDRFVRVKVQREP